MNDKLVRKVRAANGQPLIKVAFPNVGENIQILQKAMNLCGYYLAFPKFENIPQDKKWVALQFEPQFQDDATDKIRETEQFLLHLTPYYNVKKIRHIGLSPRSKNELFDFPNRVYFFKGSTNQQHIIEVGMQLNKANDSIKNDGRYALLTIDLKLIPEHVKFYNDQNCIVGLYTTNNIPSTAITDISEVQF